MNLPELRTVDVWTPDPWADPAPPLSYTRAGAQLSIYEAIGTTPAETPVLNHIGVSGGKDSDALLLWALHEAGYDKKSIVASTCETSNEDPHTYEHLELLRQLHPILRLMPGRPFWDLIRKKKIFPTRKKRWCTELLKMVPTRHFVHALSDAGFKVLLHSGVRAEESQERAKLPDRDFDGFFALPIHRPLLKWGMKEVIAIHERYELPFNPLYAMGARRVGCFPCINSVKREVRLVAQFRPDKINFIRDMERELSDATGKPKTFFHAKTTPPRFRSVPFTTKKGALIKVASIDDVVAWSLTGRRARGTWDEQGSLGLDNPAGVCSLTYGACE